MSISPEQLSPWRADLDMKTYLYLYEGADHRIYIGIGNEMTRPWQAHNNDAQALLAEPTTQVLQTPEPFSRRDDARKAEAIAIHVAALAGLRVSAIGRTHTRLLHRPPTVPE
jgi:predicted GIY-YIG superfamily endonuclease